MAKNKIKKKVIIDCDPGVDDCAAIALSLYDDEMDIELITTVCGNLSIDKVTRNILHVLELFNRTDIPVAKGATKALYRISPDATFIHKKEGLGGYIPPKTVKTQPIEQGAVEAMYEAIKKNKGNIYILALGPQTNIAQLLLDHPDVKDMLCGIYGEGCSPYGKEGEGKWTNYISFNASTDPEALDIVVNSGIPITYVPSRMGREYSHFTEEEVYEIQKINDAGEFIFEMYSNYWEPGYEDKRAATNDTCAILAFRSPKLFKIEKSKFVVDLEERPGERPGRTYITPDKKGNVDFVVGVNRKKLHKFYFEAIKKLDFLKIYNK